MSAFSGDFSGAFDTAGITGSRAYLEPAMTAYVPEDLVTADAIRAELETRTWQWHNPYAGWTFT